MGIPQIKPLSATLHGDLIVCLGSISIPRVPKRKLLHVGIPKSVDSRFQRSHSSCDQNVYETLQSIIILRHASREAASGS